MGIIRKTWKGELSLLQTFWFGWVLPSVTISAIMTTNLYRGLTIKLATISLPLSFFLIIGTPLLFFTYQVFMAISIWRSSNHYQGKIIWSISAKAIPVIYVVALLSIIGFFIGSNIYKNDPGKDSSNITKSLVKDPAYPFIGFWKNHCNEGFGLAIDKAGDGFYSVSFCGPGGCFKPGTYRPNTKLLGDSSYKIIDDDTIQVQGVDGYTSYKRCD